MAEWTDKLSVLQYERRNEETFLDLVAANAPQEVVDAVEQAILPHYFGVPAGGLEAEKARARAVAQFGEDSAAVQGLDDDMAARMTPDAG